MCLQTAYYEPIVRVSYDIMYMYSHCGSRKCFAVHSELRSRRRPPTVRESSEAFLEARNSLREFLAGISPATLGLNGYYSITVVPKPGALLLEYCDSPNFLAEVRGSGIVPLSAGTWACRLVGRRLGGYYHVLESQIEVISRTLPAYGRFPRFGLLTSTLLH